MTFLGSAFGVGWAWAKGGQRREKGVGRRPRVPSASFHPREEAYTVAESKVLRDHGS